MNLINKERESTQWDLDATIKIIELEAIFTKPSRKYFAFESFVWKTMFEGLNTISCSFPGLGTLVSELHRSNNLSLLPTYNLCCWNCHLETIFRSYKGVCLCLCVCKHYYHHLWRGWDCHSWPPVILLQEFTHSLWRTPRIRFQKDPWQIFSQSVCRSYG